MSTLDPRDNTLKSGVELTRTPIPVLELHGDISWQTMQDQFLSLRSQFVPRLREVNLVIFCHRFKNPMKKTSRGTSPRRNGPGIQR